MVSAIRSETSRPASRRACWTARTRSRATPSASSSGVSAVSSTTKPPPGSTPVAESSPPPATVSSVYSPSCSTRPPAVTVPSSATDQSPDFDALDRGLHVLAQPRAGGARVDREPLGHAVRRGVGVVGVEQADGLHVELVGDDRLEARPSRRRRRPRSSARQRQPVAQRRRPCAAPSRPSTRRAPGPSPSTSASSAGSVVGRRPVGQVHRPLAGQPAPDLLGGQRQQRRGHPADRLEHGVERVEGRLVDAARRAAQKRSRERRMYQFDSTSRNDRVESHALAIS